MIKLRKDKRQNLAPFKIGSDPWMKKTSIVQQSKWQEAEKAAMVKLSKQFLGNLYNKSRYLTKEILKLF